MRAYIKTYGCTLNQADSDIMESVLKRGGVAMDEGGELADVVIVNTCIVKKPTEQKILHMLKSLRGRRVVVAGCMAGTRKKQILECLPDASIVTTSNVHMIAEAVSASYAGRRVAFDSTRGNDKLSLLDAKSGVISKVPVSDGCLSSCSFCETKLARGPLRSYSEELVLRAIRNSVGSGAKEIQLTSQDMGAYGADRKSNVAELMQKIALIDGDFKVRIGMLNPEHLWKYLDQLIEAMRSERFYKFIHLPIQSGSDRVLSHMRRGCTSMQFLDYVAALRQGIPGITIETDIIVGYPTESLSDFDATIDLLGRARPDVTNISKFCGRPGTPAARLSEIPNVELSRRSAVLSRFVRRMQREQNESLVGRCIRVLTTETTERSRNGRSPSYKQVVIPGGEQPLGSFRDATIYAASANVLYGRIRA